MLRFVSLFSGLTLAGRSHEPGAWPEGLRLDGGLGAVGSITQREVANSRKPL